MLVIVKRHEDANMQGENEGEAEAYSLYVEVLNEW